MQNIKQVLWTDVTNNGVEMLDRFITPNIRGAVAEDITWLVHDAVVEPLWAYIVEELEEST